MSYSINDYTYISSYHEGKKGYVNKFEKSVKMPFLSVLNNQLTHIKPALIDDFELDENDLALSDIIELSSAVTGAADANASQADNLAQK